MAITRPERFQHGVAPRASTLPAQIAALAHVLALSEGRALGHAARVALIVSACSESLHVAGEFFASQSREEVRTGLFLFTLRGAAPAALAAYLEQHHQIVARSVKGEAMRLCLHVFNTEDEIERTAAAVRHVAQHGLPDDLLVTPASEG